ncbi:hypothetical protein FOZ63_002626 [Perkinsus olseni]|uniref:Palmitoyltransferase n=1 Tax=Perkinsus olseni TaxID=32597 RepID=A0A7J6UJY8_PEROL|nr:hypothetical protein FOZ62_001401 [Perkinsus olseni]KAF4757338.1 hypothetical protein FOZ63_002626 [Perkinsus olseni]
MTARSNGSSDASPDLAVVARELRAAKDGPPSSRDLTKEWYEKWVRKNGFSKPLSRLQLLSWMTFAVDVALGAVISLPVLLSDGQWYGWVISLLWTGSAVLTLVSTHRATACDPTDDSSAPSLGATRFCHFCRRNVSTDAKHCRQCNKCIGDFDHHCEWLNNCIGRDNYFPFACATTSAFVFTASLVAFSSVEIGRFVSEGSEVTVERWRQVYSDVDDRAVLGISVTILLINLPLTLCVLQLLSFHAFLAYKGLTTYEYIMYKLNGEQAERSNPPQGRRVWSRFKSLPSVMDWFVFAGSSKRKGRPQEASRTERASGSLKVPGGVAQVDGGSRCSSRSSGTRRVEPIEVVVGTPKGSVR